MNGEAREQIEGPALAKGQVWTMSDQQLQIYHTGKILVEFRLFKLPTRTKKLPRPSLETIQTVQQFLQRNNAILQV
jgi:hypothetical protein